MVPLSYLLKNADGQHILPGVRGIYKAADGFGHGHDTPEPPTMTPMPPRSGAAGVGGGEADAVLSSTGRVVRSVGSVCQNNTDMKYSDIADFGAPSQDACFAACSTEEGAVGWVWDECDKHCWCKSANGAVSQAPCRCYGVMPPVPIPAVNVSAQVETCVFFFVEMLLFPLAAFLVDSRTDTDRRQQSSTEKDICILGKRSQQGHFIIRASHSLVRCFGPRYMEYILGHQTADGWLGPAAEETSQDGNKWWGRSNVLLAMCMYAEAEPDRLNTLATAMLK